MFFPIRYCFRCSSHTFSLLIGISDSFTPVPGLAETGACPDLPQGSAWVCSQRAQDARWIWGLTRNAPISSFTLWSLTWTAQIITNCLRPLFQNVFKILQDNSTPSWSQVFVNSDTDYSLRFLQGCCQMLFQAIGQNLPPAHVLRSHWHQWHLHHGLTAVNGQRCAGCSESTICVLNNSF